MRCSWLWLALLCSCSAAPGHEDVVLGDAGAPSLAPDGRDAETSSGGSWQSTTGGFAPVANDSTGGFSSTGGFASDVTGGSDASGGAASSGGAVELGGLPEMAGEQSTGGADAIGGSDASGGYPTTVTIPSWYADFGWPSQECDDVPYGATTCGPTQCGEEFRSGQPGIQPCGSIELGRCSGVDYPMCASGMTGEHMGIEHIGVSDHGHCTERIASQGQCSVTPFVPDNIPPEGENSWVLWHWVVYGNTPAQCQALSAAFDCRDMLDACEDGYRSDECTEYLASVWDAVASADEQ